LEGSVAKAQNQKRLIGTLVALIVLAVTSSGFTTLAPPEVATPIKAASVDTVVTLTSMATKQGPTSTSPLQAPTPFETAKALPMVVPNPPLDLLTCALEHTSNTYWTEYMDTAVGILDSDRCGGLPRRKTCHCLNPVVPVPRKGKDKVKSKWFRAYKRNLQLIADTVSTTAPGTGATNLDVVLIGDSITEQWLGTLMGTKDPKRKEHFQVYQELFQNKNSDDNNNKTTSGLALGIGGDMSPHLLYRLLNGEMAELHSNASSAALQPAVWWILIGTNDYGNGHCEAKQIVTGTVRIVQEMLKRRPSATVVVNSILPRGRNWRLDSDWYETLTVVNRQMECYAASQKRVEFFNATDYFVERGGDHSGRVNRTLMTDQVHPAAAGYRIWGQGIVDRVKEIKQQRSKN
jgi:lysophospholipase L1-like esterase